GKVDQVLGDSSEVQVQQHEGDEDRERHDHFEARLSAFQVLELPAPGDVIARGEFDLCSDRLLGIGDVPAEVAIPKINVDVSGELGVLGANARRSRCKAYLGDFSQWDGAAVR